MIKKKSFPKVGEVFELTLDGDTSANTPLGMVRDFGYKPENWKHQGEVVTGRKTKKFRLVQVGCRQNLEAVRQAIKSQHGVAPESHQGQWMQTYRQDYDANEVNTVGIPDPSWVDPDGHVSFPYVNKSGRPFFSWSERDFYESRLWLIPADDETPADSEE